MANTDPPHPIKAFVSYSHDSRQHDDGVLAFCDRLRQGGIEANLDQYEAAPPEGWPRWMVRQIEDANFVLLVCTETYRRRFEGREEPGRGLGANWEGSIVTLDLYKAAGVNSKFIPVILSSEDEAHIPTVLAGATRYRVDTPEGYEALYRYLTDQPAVLRPQRGSIRSLPPRPRASIFPAPLPSSRRGPGKVILLLVVLGILISIALAAALTFRPYSEPVWLRSPEPTPLRPGIYAVRVQVVDPKGQPVAGSTLRASTGNEPQRTPDGWWEVEIPSAKVPAAGRITLWAEHPDWGGNRKNLVLGADSNVQVEIQLKAPESWLRGQVIDESGRGLEGVRVSRQDGTPGEALTDSEGRFALSLAVPPETQIRLRADPKAENLAPVDMFCLAGRDTCSFLLEKP